MKNRKNRVLALVLALVMVLGLTLPAFAAAPTFTDVPSTYWGYADIEAVAEAGLMNGTGNGKFSPDLKVSVAQFLTLLGRLVFPDTKVTEGSSWYGPYVIAARTNGLLEGTQVDITNVEAEISRYDMAVILRAAAKKLGIMEKTAQTSQVKDYGEIPTKYAQAVLAVYGMGLIKGDQTGNFNGSNTMIRAEVATVIMRLAKLSGKVTEPENSIEPEKPKSEKVMASMEGQLTWYEPAHWRDYTWRSAINQHVAYELRYTEDGGKTYRVVTTGTTDHRDPKQPDKTTASFLNPAPFEADRSLFDNPDGQFYISAETYYKDLATGATVEQHLVTWDRRDVRACIYPVQFTAGKDGDSYYVKGVDVPLVPPTSKTVTVAFEGWCEAYVWADGDKLPHSVSPSDVTVKLAYCPDGYDGWQGDKNGGRYVKFLGETISDSDGKFRLEAEVDELDYYPNKALYTVYADATKEGMYFFSEPDSIVSIDAIQVGYKRAALKVRTYNP